MQRGRFWLRSARKFEEPQLGPEELEPRKTVQHLHKSGLSLDWPMCRWNFGQKRMPQKDGTYLATRIGPSLSEKTVKVLIS